MFDLENAHVIFINLEELIGFTEDLSEVGQNTASLFPEKIVNQ